MDQSPFPSKTITFAGRDYAIQGHADDPYFRQLEGVPRDLQPIEAWVRRNLPEDAVVIDAGSNIGVTSLLLSGLLPHGKVHLFEANPANAVHLRANIENNGVRNCILNEVALGAEPGTVIMQGGGSSSHVAMGATAGLVAPGGAVPMLTLDGYAQACGLDRLDFIKMDVEGFEPAVLEGGRMLIERSRAPVFMEFNSWCLNFVQGYDARGFAASLWQAFEVLSVDVSGDERPAGEGSVSRFLHDNVVLHGTVEDVLLRLRPGGLVPRQGAMIPLLPDEEARKALAEALRQLDAIHASTSWRITAPLRMLRRRLTGRTSGD